MGYPTIYYTNSSDYGTTWATETNLTDNYGDYADLAPALAQASNGTIWLVWASNRPPPASPPSPDFAMAASPANLTIPKGASDTSTIIVTSIDDFNEAVDLTVIHTITNITTALDPPQVTPPPNGTANSTLTITVGTYAVPGNYTLWVMGRSSSRSHTVELGLEIVESASSSSLSASSPLTRSTSKEDASGGAYKIYYKTSHDYGATWSQAAQLEPTSESDDASPAILQAADGTLWIVFHSYRTGNHELFYTTSTDGGASWTAAEQLTNSANSDKTPAIAQTWDGQIWVTWSSYRTGHSEVYYKTYDGVSWSSDTRLTYSSNVDSGPSVLQTYDGTIWIFWSSAEESDKATADIFYQYSLDGGASWSGRIQFTSDGAEDMWSSATQVDNLEVWVVWASNRTGNFELFYRTSLVGDITGPVGQPDNVVDTYDLALVTEGFGLTEGDANWLEYEAADLTGPANPPESMCYPPDKIISIFDLAAVGKNYGET